MSQADVKVVGQLLEAWNAGDIEAAASLVHDECVIDATDRVFNPDSYAGRDGFRRFADEVSDVWQRFGFQARELMDAGDQVVALGASRGEGRGSGIEIVQESAWVFTVRDALIVHGRLYHDRVEALEAVGLSE